MDAEKEAVTFARDSRVIIASNRLPLRMDATSGRLLQSSGGLVTALLGIQWEKTPIWVGTVPENWSEQARAALSEELRGFRYRPVSVTQEDYGRYYSGLSNGALWPLLHYAGHRVAFDWEEWEAYKRVNQKFAAEIAAIANAGDLVWIHDYQLMLVPEYLRKLKPELRIGFFLHVPWPSSEVFRQLPARNEILQGLLCADLVGFHDYSYLRHFCTATQLLLGAESNMLWVDCNDHITRLGVHPVSIDSQAIRTCAASEGVAARLAAYRQRQTCPHTILGVDRLDYSKGIDLKLQAFREALRQFPELVGKVTLVQIAVPSREEVPEYQRLKATVEQLVGEINGEFGAPHYVPVQYIFGSVDQEELIALYRSAEVLLVTSTRDGMNLVALEYLVAQPPEHPGTVLLSEFAGAGSTLSGVVLVNPWDVAETGRVMGETLLRPNPHRAHAHRVMIEYLARYDATAWARAFLSELASTGKSERLHHGTIAIDSAKAPPTEISAPLLGRRRLLFLDYDGTLSPIAARPEEAVLPAEARAVLARLTSQPDWEVVVVSGRPRNFLAQQLEGLSVGLAAEHGAWFRARDQAEWSSRVNSDKKPWFSSVRRIMEDYSARVPQSFVEEKAYCLAWHYRLSPEEFARYQSRKLVEDLEMALLHFPARVVTGKKVIEARAIEADKGAFAQWLLRHRPDLASGSILAVGDDETDEDMFAALAGDGITVRIGREPTRARYRLCQQSELVPFLDRLATLTGSSNPPQL